MNFKINYFQNLLFKNMEFLSFFCIGAEKFQLEM